MTEHTRYNYKILAKSLELPCGKTIKNRFMKSAMSENLGTVDNRMTPYIPRLYETFAEGGTGLVVTGNVMIDQRALGEARNVVVEDERDLPLLQEWANVGTKNNTHLWVQLNHPGKQIPSFLAKEPVAPSAVPLGGNLEKAFNTPRELLPEEIEDIILRFARSAEIVKKAGFTGVQIHGAHGYLVSEFLSPHHNRRNDDWGGTPEKRMKFAVEVYRAIRERVGNDFPVGIKLNSADFQRGGFSNDESLDVMETLSGEGMDLIEISGGNYEKPAMTGAYVRESTREREAYFLEFAEKVRQKINTPLVVTGGFRTGSGMINAVESGATDMIGLARPLAVDPYLPSKILAGEDYTSPVHPLSSGFKVIDTFSMLEVSWYAQQLFRMSRGNRPDPDQSVWTSILKTFFNNGYHAFQKQRAKQ
ncbi:MAG: NADH:flavin oxidoreductase/NADH oxidase family protein [Proteobacteria bacterium]|nr:NADH:flavin oxidoreductase/NADH oxidase family protein [Pseudomonadota bacterium]